MTPDYAELERLLTRLRLGIQASDLHGSLSGYFCAGGRADADNWPQAMQLDVDAVDVAQDPLLRQLYLVCREQFEGPCADVTPLLPPAATPLVQRVDALAQWCRGFLGGCGLAGTLSQTALSTDMAGIFADFSAIAAGRFNVDDGAEDEQAFAEVLEFVCTATALLHRQAGADAQPVLRVLH